MGFRKLSGKLFFLFFGVLLLVVIGVIMACKSKELMKEHINSKDMALWSQLPNEKIIFTSKADSSQGTISH